MGAALARPVSQASGGGMTALTANEVAALTGYTPRVVRELYRLGRFPAPIDATLHPKAWRWSPVAVDQYVAGEWLPSAKAAS